jgi:hypothetical protein
MENIPRSVGIPKFLRPAEILQIKKAKSLCPEISWEEAVSWVVFNSVRTIAAAPG